MIIGRKPAPRRLAGSLVAATVAAAAVAAAATGTAGPGPEWGGASVPGQPASATVALRTARPATGELWAADRWLPGTGLDVSAVANIIGANAAYSAGLDGTGIGVALIDSGVAQVPGLPAAHLVNGPDLSVESQAPNLRYLDTYGHGTHMAGIIAGNDPASGLRGIAPGAKLTSVKVAAADGAVDVTQVMAAINWVVAHRNDDPRNPIRVINLSYGTDANALTANDPLLYAVESAWKAGIVVVVAGGNQGSSLGWLDDPGVDWSVIAVGSASTNGTVGQNDDQVSSFSSVGGASRGVDLVAPGESIVSARDPGSYIDTTYPSAQVGTSLFRGSGSSQATAVVSGAVALLLQKYPRATPDQIRFCLRSAAAKLHGASNNTTTAGEVNVAAAIKAGLPGPSVQTILSNGTGSLDAARGSIHLVHNSAALIGASDLFGSFNTSAWAAATGTGTAWQGGLWMGHRLAGDGWTGASWASKTWAAATWSSTDWSQQSWADTDWSGHYWSGRAWSGTDWAGHYWSATGWDGAGWATAGWR